MATIKSGASTDVLTIGSTNKAARIEVYDARGNSRGVKATYRAATAAVLVAAAGTGLFFAMQGSSTKTVRIQRIKLSGLTLTAVAYNSIQLAKYSTTVSGGTATALVATQFDTTDGAATANLINVYTAAPTAGSLVGTLGSIRVLMQATTAAATGIPDIDIGWDFRNLHEVDQPTLRGTAQGIALNFVSSPASAVSLSLEVEWTEE